jgi:TPR repeat protein
MFPVPTKSNSPQVKTFLETSIQDKKQFILSKWVQKGYKEKFIEKYKDSLKKSFETVMPKLIQTHFIAKPFGQIFTILVSDIPTDISQFVTLVGNQLKPSEDTNFGKLKSMIAQILKDQVNMDMDIIFDILPQLRKFAILLVIADLIVGEKATAQIKHYLKFVKSRDEFAEISKLTLQLSKSDDKCLKTLETTYVTNAIAEFHLGHHYRKEDMEKGIKLIILSAEKGFAPAQSWLGTQYLVGDNGVQKDVQKGIDFLEKAATTGEVTAQYHLGVLYGKGVDVPANFCKAIHWYTKAMNNTEFCSGYETAKQLARENLKILEQKIDFDIEFEAIEENIHHMSKEDQKDMAEQLRVSGNEFFNAKSLEYATKFYLAGLKYDPENYLILSNLSIVLYQKQQWKDSIAICVKCLNVNPKYAKAWVRKGLCYQQLNKLKDAKECFEKAVELEKDNEEYVKILNEFNSKTKI